MSEQKTETETEDLNTYWYHPESDCLVVFRQSEQEKFLESYDGGLCTELDPKEYIRRMASVKDLPDDVTGVIKNAVWWPFNNEKNVISGDLYFDRRQRFPDGLNIQTSRVVKVREDGVYVTQHSAYLVQWHPTVQAEIDAQAIQEKDSK